MSAHVVSQTVTVMPWDDLVVDSDEDATGLDDSSVHASARVVAVGGDGTGHRIGVEERGAVTGSGWDGISIASDDEAAAPQSAAAPAAYQATNPASVS